MFRQPSLKLYILAIISLTGIFLDESAPERVLFSFRFPGRTALAQKIWREDTWTKGDSVKWQIGQESGRLLLLSDSQSWWQAADVHGSWKWKAFTTWKGMSVSSNTQAIPIRNLYFLFALLSIVNAKLCRTFLNKNSLPHKFEFFYTLLVIAFPPMEQKQKSRCHERGRQSRVEESNEPGRQ